MLEVRGLSKIYKTKKGADVKALDNVSLQFPKTGMVFLLGKSGSGKSTLLNVCGGLDAPTSGEILVKGRSSKEFSQSDFDSYRNTYVGFIFQEYNILNEFSVEDNIALALELQGKPKDKKAVAELLRQVDLEGYAKRKPNTLSGGQKQRIAIARALVKSPEIIMADEPTGALDSVTGKQVLETLKKLSNDKLVIVVSHDREFAEQYGDRIIELKDGQVLSDVSKTQEEQRVMSENITSVDGVLCIKKGTELKESDFEVIRSFLQTSDHDVIIANGEEDVKNFKKVSRITTDGEKEVFRETDEGKIEKREYTKEESRFIRSKLPAKHAIRIGVSSLKMKPIRLFFTIILCTVAFVLFGLLSTMSFYDSESTFKQTMIDTDHSILRLEKNFKAKEVVYQNGEKSFEYDNFFEARFSQDELSQMKEKFGNEVFGGVPVWMEYNIRSKVAPYWMNQISTIAYLEDGHSLRNQINGQYPATKDEICISSYMADVMMNCMTYDDAGNVIEVSSTEQLLGRKINISGQIYTITGILDSGAISEKFDALKSAETENDQLIYEMNSALQDGLQFVAYVSYDRLQMIAEDNKPYAGEELFLYRQIAVEMFDQDGKRKYPDWSNAKYVQLSEMGSKEHVYYVDGEKTALAENEVLLTKGLFMQIMQEQYNNKVNALGEDYEAAEKYYKSMELMNEISNGGVWKQNPDTKKEELIKFTDEQLQQKMNQFITTIKNDKIDLKINAKLFNSNSQAVYGDEKSFTIVGIVTSTEEGMEDKLYVSDSVLQSWWDEQKLNVDYYSMNETKYVEEPGAVYGHLFLPYDKSEAQTQTFWDMYQSKEYADDDSRIKPTGVFIDRLEMIDSMVKELSKVFLYVGLVLAVFAALLLSNFISVSISQKKKEIGILRAVGARSLDVFKIFFSESFVISAICVLIATVGSNVICTILNTEVAAELGASLFVFGIPSFAVLILIAVLTTIIATFLPVWNAARKKPVESIRAL